MTCTICDMKVSPHAQKIIDEDKHYPHQPDFYIRTLIDIYPSRPNPDFPLVFCHSECYYDKYGINGGYVKSFSKKEIKDFNLKLIED